MYQFRWQHLLGNKFTSLVGWTKSGKHLKPSMWQTLENVKLRLLTYMNILPIFKHFHAHVLNIEPAFVDTSTEAAASSWSIPVQSLKAWSLPCPVWTRRKGTRSKKQWRTKVRTVGAGQESIGEGSGWVDLWMREIKYIKVRDWD